MTDRVSVEARYFDGRASTPRRVWLWVQERRLCIAEADAGGTWIPVAPRAVPWFDLEVSERLAAAPRLVRLPDGGHLEVVEQDAFDRLLEALQVEDGVVARWQRHWPLALLGVVATALFCWGAYLWAVPRMAGWVAARTPMAVETAIGRGALEAVERQFLSPSALPAARQQALERDLAPLVASEPGRQVRVIFRKTALGPNAFALPGGTVVVTDDLVGLVPSTEALAAVVAHELGHVHHRHVLRRIAAGGLMGAAATLVVGDVSGVVASIPAALATLAYSRDMEREADAHAVRLLRRQGMDPEALAQALEALEREAERQTGVRGEGGDEAAPSGRSRSPIPAYLSSHPATAERIRAIRAAR